MSKIALRIAAYIGILAAAISGTQSSSKMPDRPEVQIPQGRLTGTITDDIGIFKGIAYALPPVGDRRWQPPAPPAKWQGTFDASAFGASCIQPPYPASSVYFEELAATSEDCLTLNIWSPNNANGAPVVVWIHGGALQRGSSASPMYDGSEYAKRGIVFVSINYRLGVFGWLAHPGLSAESPDGISGNYGLLDQIAALAWVKDNIGAFGGDAQNVTVMGESAGALSITYLLSSPPAHGLFAKAIIQSANIRAVPLLRESAFGMPAAETIGAALGEDIGVLRALDPDALMVKAWQARFPAQGTVDGKILPAQVVETFDRSEQAQVPILAGLNSGEIRSQRLLIPAAPNEPDAYEIEITKRFGNLAPAYLQLYPASNIAESQLDATRDAVYGWAIERLVRQQTAAGQPAFSFIFDHCYAAAKERDLCSFHAGELPFTFGRVGPDKRLPANWPIPVDPADDALATTMIDYWASFATTGAPSSVTGPAWPPYANDQARMRFAATPVVGHGQAAAMFELQEQIMKQRRCNGEQWFLNMIPLKACPVDSSPND
ncbi:carboxylesterase/lipase family protein [Sphingorhabdus sp. M41]|uniref:carboxylesterase/lipase family protein n=1 Tax=Sphingorhabdus sp. M41 TaxID=1806885 RepID=UPI00078C74BA|nr:carboxylesterase family protein [Sphingorhabdus sp. M41]AMO70613.1 carboxylesterase [Sphingorhabdus sp. M41]